MGSYLLGIITPHKKGTKNSPVARIDNVQTVTIPMSMHIGKPAIPVVKVGDTVKIGTKIGEADGKVSSNIYSSISGKVVKILDHLLYSGQTTPAIVIESDGEKAVDESVAPPVINNKQDFIDAVTKCGLVGLGGAGFPTQVKLDVPSEKIEYIIINGAECEPYVTSDTVNMMSRSDDMALALNALHSYLGVKKVIIGVEKGNKQGVAAMKKLADTISNFDIKVNVLPDKYPQGGEKVLVYHTTGRKIAANKLPIDVGCIVLNSTTIAELGTYLRTGMPLVEKCVTVEGGAVKQPQNVIAPIGTSFKALFDFCGGLKEDPEKLIYGGPMMGITVTNTDAPVLKNTNAILALTKKEAKLPKTTDCIHCGACVNTCPFSLAPVNIALAYAKEDVEALQELSVMSCMECGCCSFVCPANRPLVQINKLSKNLLKNKA